MLSASSFLSSNEKLRAKAAGSFVSNRTPPIFSKPESHPVMKTFKGNLEVRKHQLVTSSKTSGIITIYKNRVITLNIPQIGYDPIEDEDESNPLITGAVGLEVAKAYPAYIPLADATADVVYLGTQEDTALLPGGVKLSNNLFQKPQDPEADKIPRPFEGDIYAFRVPHCIPMLQGTDILEGSIVNDDVVSALDYYHVSVGAWAKAMQTMVKDKKRIANPTLIKSLKVKLGGDKDSITLSDKVSSDVSLIANEEGEDSLWSVTSNRIRQIAEANISQYMHSHPEEFPTKQGEGKKSKTKDDIEEKALLDGKHSRALVGFMLALATVDEENMSVTIPELSQDFADCFQWDTMELICRTYKSCIQDFMNDRQEQTRDYFFRRLNGPKWSSATLSLFLKGIWHDDGLDDNRHNLSHSISILNFLADPPASNNAEYLEYLKKSHLEDLEALVEEASEKRQKIGLKVFIGGKQDTPEDVITALANIDAHFAFITPFDHKPKDQQPLLVKYLREIADLLSSKDFVRFNQKFISLYPWIPHMILAQVQLVFAEFATIARNNRYISMVRRGDEIPFSVFARPIQVFRDSMRELTRAVTQSNVSYYSTAPPTYTFSTKPSNQENRDTKQEEKGRDKANKKKELAKKGWFNAIGSFAWPEGLSCRPCNRFGQIGAVCFRSDCKFAHKTFPDQFGENDRKILVAFEAAEKNFSFASHITVPDQGTSGTCNKSGACNEPPKKRAKVEENKEKVKDSD